MAAGSRFLPAPGRGPAVTHLRPVTYLRRECRLVWGLRGGVAGCRVVWCDFDGAIADANAVIEGAAAARVEITDLAHAQVVCQWRRFAGGEGS